MFSLSADSVTVPAHGTAAVTATARPGLGANGRRYLGQVSASDSSGAVRARTQVGLYREEERYSLDVTLKDRSGEPASGYVQLQRFGTDAEPQFVAVGDSGTATVRLQASRPTAR